MKSIFQKTQRSIFYVTTWCLVVMLLSGCALFQPSGVPYPGSGGSGGQIAPSLSNATISPNPTSSGTVVNLSVTYSDPDADLQFGVAAVAIDGSELSKIAFRSIYPSGILTIPLAVSHYSRSSDMNVVIKIRDSSGNWSNAVSTVLSIR